MNECGQDGGFAKLLLLQVGLNLVETGAIQFEWVATNDMAADGLTKALTNDKHAVL